MEWRQNNEFNGFNSWKALLYSRQYEAIAAGTFLPPVVVTIDPIHKCNFKCNHCNAQNYLYSTRPELREIPEEHLIKLLDFLSGWGVKAVSFVGGGEPTLHPALGRSVAHAKKVGLSVSIITNGFTLHEELIDTLVKNCRWIGVSVDAATPETFKTIKDVDGFETVLFNIQRLVGAVKRTKVNCDIAYKYLITPFSQHEILSACRVARDIGVRDFHVRPVDPTEWSTDPSRVLDIQLIETQYEACHRLETDFFRVFTVKHKFDENFLPLKNFSQCYAAPLTMQICADGGVYFCADQRLNPEYLLGRHYPDVFAIRGFWGSPRHRELVFDSGKSKCKSRCQLAPCNRQCEALFIREDDPMCKEFLC